MKSSGERFLAQALGMTIPVISSPFDGQDKSVERSFLPLSEEPVVTLEFAGGFEVVDTAPDQFDEIMTHHIVGQG